MAKTEAESRLQRRCQVILKENNAFVFKTHGNIFTRAGLPDLVGCVPVTIDVLMKMIEAGWFKDNKIGVFVSFETKRENRLNELSDAQSIVGKEIKNSGGIWFPVDDSDIVTAVMKTMKGEM